MINLLIAAGCSQTEITAFCQHNGLEVKMKPKLKKWDVVRFFTKGEERSVTGFVTYVQGRFPDYVTVGLNVDGMKYEFGTGGHLGTTWTTESGSEEWFAEVVSN